jgi:hypothetical protein
MSHLDCRRVRALVPAYHDGELTMELRVRVQAHLRTCRGCLAERQRLSDVGHLLRDATALRRSDDSGRLERHVLARLQAERATSWSGHFNRLFEDMHLVWAAAGATAATMIIVCAVVAVMALALRERPASMAWIIDGLATPGSNRNPVSVDGRMLLPRSEPGALISTPLGSSDMVVALSAVVTREGRVGSLELLRPDMRRLPVAERELLELLDAASQARFEPARAVGGAPVAVNLVWLVAHTTVRGQASDAWPAMKEPPRRRVVPATLPPALPVSEGPLPSPRPEVAAA